MQLIVTLSVPVDEVLYGVFVADSPDVVNETCQRAGIPPHRLTPDVGTRIQGATGHDRSRRRTRTYSSVRTRFEMNSYRVPDEGRVADRRVVLN